MIGLGNVEKIEKAIDPVTQQRFSSTLAALMRSRNSEAHTHLKGVTRQINAPSFTLSQFQDVYHGLTSIDKALRQRNL